ncbi:transposase [Pantoea sp. 18069]|uniref:transposase n=1 Tax=Pantoea sp. 18069 TaxID=2681415 RepID=UPI0013570E75|nr:transposase [Pantoea sp. 18069]
MLKNAQSPRYSVPRTRRTYTPQFKAELIAACLQPGASIATTAREHGMNANVLHRWLKEHRLGQHQPACDTAYALAYDIAARRDDAAAPSGANAQPVRAPAHPPHASTVPAFIAMTLGSPVMQSQEMVAQAASSATSSDIRIECCMPTKRRYR